MRELISAAIEAALTAGASYADARVTEATWERVHALDGRLAGIDRGHRSGLGVRVRVDDAWGFAASTQLTRPGAYELGLEAVAQARGAAMLLTRGAPLAPVPAVSGTWESPYRTDPFTVDLAEKAAILQRTDETTRRFPSVETTAGHLSAGYQTTHFGSSDGSDIVQSRMVTGFGGQVTARSENLAATRSFPRGLGGYYAQGGWELIEALDLPALALDAVREATGLINAIDVATGTWDVILSGQVLALLLHETCGHAAELDVQLGFELGRRGPVTWSDAGRARFGSDHVTIVSDAEQRGGLGTYAWDDEGVAPERTVLIEEGVWIDFLRNREIAGHLGLPLRNGCMRAESFAHPPALRMNNISLQPGGWSYEALIASTERAILVDTPLRLVVDPGRGWFRLWAEIAWEVEDGELRRMTKGVLIEGDVAEFWASCDAVCSGRSYELHAITDCEKCLPGQLVGTSHGAAPARFRNVRVEARRT